MKTRLLIISLLMAIGIFANAQSHYIGEIVTAPDGQQGIVFYVSNDGQDYWLVALNDLPQSYAWGDLTDIPDLENVDDSFFIHYNPCGYDATTAMKDYQDDNPNYAASAVNTKQFWCIPSTGQASKLYAAMPYIQHLFAQNGGIAPGINYDHYWTSTEKSYNQAYIIYLGVTNYQGGAISTAYKDEFLGVRPIWCQPCTNELPSVGQIVAPDEICSGSSLTLDAPETQNADNGGWQIAPDADFSNCQEYQGEALDESFDGWYLRYFASNFLGIVYSNTVQISVLYVPTSSFSINSCGSYTWNDQTYTESGSYQQYFPMPNGCDSIVTCNLTIWQDSFITLYATSCDFYTFCGVTYTQSGNYEHVFNTAHGCDSIVTLHLTINPSVSIEFMINTCDSFNWNGTEYTESGDYEQTFTSSTGCDSIVTMHLTIESAISNDFMISTCDSFIWNGTEYSESGDYQQTFTSSMGCDSIVTLHLIIEPAISNDFMISTCDSFIWNGTEYNESGDYQQTFTTPMGCDSIVTLHLTIEPAINHELMVNACDSFIWNDTEYSESGDYEQTFTTPMGCDSIVDLHLTINPSVSYSFMISTCDSYIWNGTEYAESGDYEQTFTSSTGCDSIVTLHLTVESFDEMQSIVGDIEVDSYLTPSSIFTQPGFLISSNYQWNIEPAEAGTLMGNGNTVIVNWSPEFKGNATLTVIISNACGEGNNTITVDVKNSFDVSENSINAKLYPNPTSGDINIEVPEMRRITVMNTLGQTVVETELDADTASINMAQYGRGMYLIRIQTRNGSCTKRFWVE